MGGAATHLPQLLLALRAARADWHITILVSAGEERLVPDAAGVEVAPVRTTRAGRLLWEARGLERRSQWTHASCLINLTNHGPFRSNIPSILFQRNSLYFDPKWVARLSGPWRAAALARRGLAFKEIRAASATVTPSEAMARYLQAWAHAPTRANYAVIPHGVELDRFTFSPRPWRSLDRVRLAVVGHPAPHKGIDTAISLTAELYHRGIDSSLALTVDRTGYPGRFQHYVDGCVNLASRLGIADRVELVGRMQRVEDLYRMADVIVAPSLTESFGFPVLEALACGTPVLSTAIPAAQELAAGCAAWFPPGDHSEAANQLERVATMPLREASAILARGRQRAEAFTWDKSAEALARLASQEFRPIAGRRRRRG